MNWREGKKLTGDFAQAPGLKLFSKASSVTSCDHLFIIINPQVLEASNRANILRVSLFSSLKLASNRPQHSFKRKIKARKKCMQRRRKSHFEASATRPQDALTWFQISPTTSAFCQAFVQGSRRRPTVHPSRPVSCWPDPQKLSLKKLYNTPPKGRRIDR